MPLLAASANTQAAGQLALAAGLAVAGVVLLLPRPRGRAVAAGVAALVAAAAVLGAWAHTTFGEPGANWVEKLLFVLFGTGAVGFGTVLVVQRNPARGAIAFAFVILSTCGLFLLLAAPFLMAATVIIYAGAIIVTFLFVLMLSHVEGPSDENDRSREPLLGGLAGFAFAGLVLFALHLTAGPAAVEAGQTPEALRPPAALVTDHDRARLAAAAEKLAQLDGALGGGPLPAGLDTRFDEAEADLDAVVGTERAGRVAADGPVADRLAGRAKARPPRPDESLADRQAAAAADRVRAVRAQAKATFNAAEVLVTAAKPDPAPVRAECEKLRAAVDALRADLDTLDRLALGERSLPARNVANLGFVLYTDHLLAVELAGTLLLVATIGAIAIAQRKGATP